MAPDTVPLVGRTVHLVVAPRGHSVALVGHREGIHHVLHHGDSREEEDGVAMEGIDNGKLGGFILSCLLFFLLFLVWGVSTKALTSFRFFFVLIMDIFLSYHLIINSIIL